MKVAFIGMGTMGAPMAQNILKAGHEVVVHNRTREKELPVADAGAYELLHLRRLQQVLR